MIARIKYIIFALTLISAFIAGYNVNNHKQIVEYVYNIKPSESIIIKPINKNDCADLLKRANSLIMIDRLFDNNALTITASDGYKKTTVYDEINIPVKQHLIFAGFGVNKEFFYTYTIGYMRQIYLEGVFCGGVVSVNPSGLQSLQGLIGYNF
jgi:hypothetical protein